MQSNYNIFKNSGIRTQINDNSFISPENATFIGHALADFITSQYQQQVNIIIATDTRPSGKWIKKNLLQGLASQYLSIFDAGIAPTPFIAKALKDYAKSKFQLGIVITASHNPAEYNGLKILTPHGYLHLEDEYKLSTLFQKYKNLNKTYDTNPLVNTIDLTQFYLDETKKLLVHKNFPNLHLLVDCANGATYTIAKSIFKAYKIKTTMINSSADGNKINQNSGCSNPQLLLQTLKEKELDWACAFDGDGDRVILVYKDGTILDGDDLILILSKHPALQKESTFVGTIMSNKSVQDNIHLNKKTFIRTDVGERNLIQALQKHKALLGAESCGHITFMDHAFCSDGIFATLLFFDTIAKYKISDIIQAKKLPQLHATLNIKNKNLQTTTIDQLVSTHNSSAGRIIARKSNTEPVLRLMVEHPDEKIAQTKLTLIENEFKKSINEGSTE